mgnify:CR=1 FL=1
MPLYEMQLVCRMGPQGNLASMLKAVSKTILLEGGVVRHFVNLGDRVLVRNARSVDGSYHGIGRFMQVR